MGLFDGWFAGNAGSSGVPGSQDDPGGWKAATALVNSPPDPNAALTNRLRTLAQAFMHQGQQPPQQVQGQQFLPSSQLTGAPVTWSKQPSPGQNNGL